MVRPGPSDRRLLRRPPPHCLATGKMLLATLLLAACAPTPLKRQETHPTIVSLNPCTDAILAEVARPEQLLAISHYSHDPRATSMPLAEARRYPATGGTVEEVLALDPDVVVATSFLPPATAQAFDRLGIEVQTFGIASDIETSKAQVRRLATLAGNKQAGEALIGRIDHALAQTRPEGSPVTALVWQQGGIVPGEGSLIAALLAHTGFANHAAARRLGQGAYLPLERVLADPPDLVLAAGGERMLTHPVLREVEEMSYERLDPSLLFCGGPTIIRAVERLAEVRQAMRARASTDSARTDVGASESETTPLVLSWSKGARLAGERRAR